MLLKLEIQLKHHSYNVHLNIFYLFLLKKLILLKLTLINILNICFLHIYMYHLLRSASMSRFSASTPRCTAELVSSVMF